MNSQFDRERAIEVLSHIRYRVTGHDESELILGVPRNALLRTLDNAISLIKPHILDFEDMIEAGKNGDAVYVEESPQNSYRRCYWAIAVEGIEPPKDGGYNYPGGVQFNTVDADQNMLDGDLYWLNSPLGWRAWSGKPTEEQMQKEGWGGD